MWMTLEFYACVTIEKVHPLDGGIFRRKYRCDRRYGLPLENPIVFYSRYLWEIVKKHVRFFWVYRNYKRICKKVMEERSQTKGVDVAMEPVKATNRKKTRTLQRKGNHWSSDGKK